MWLQNPNHQSSSKILTLSGRTTEGKIEDSNQFIKLAAHMDPRSRIPAAEKVFQRPKNFLTDPKLRVSVFLSQKPQHTYAQQLRFHLAQHMSAQTHSSHCLFDKHAPSSTNYKSSRTTSPASTSSSTNFNSRNNTTRVSASSNTNYNSKRTNVLQVVRITCPN